jgi:glycosyltransferase involved in cell wall biosynthesis
MKLTVLVPVYCSENTISKLYESIINVLSDFKEGFEIVFVNDSSNDNSWEIIKSICLDDDRVKGICLNKNYGQHNALFCGIKNSSGELILTMDDDLQHPPQEIIKLLNEIDKGYDVVYGVPRKLTHSFFRNLLSKFIKYIIHVVMGFDHAQKINSFRVFKRNLLNNFLEIQNSKVNIDVLLSWSTKNFSSIDVEHNRRKDGASGYTFRKLINHTLVMMTNFSSIPLKFASYLGFIFSILGFVILIHVLINALFFSNPVPGFPFLASMISIFSGVQLLTLGIFGEYLSNIHIKSISKPMYIIKEFTSKKN